MISQAMSDKADSYDIEVIADNDANLWVLVGYLVRYNRKTGILSCNCKSEVFGSKCSHKIAAIRKADVPLEIKETLEAEGVIE